MLLHILARHVYSEINGRNRVSFMQTIASFYKRIYTPLVDMHIDIDLRKKGSKAGSNT